MSRLATHSRGVRERRAFDIPWVYDFDEMIDRCGRLRCGGKLRQLSRADGLVESGAGRNRQLQQIPVLAD